MAKSVIGFPAILRALSGASVALSLCLSPALFAQDHDRYRYWDRERHRFTRLEPGTIVAVRTNEPIDVERTDNRVFYGTVDQDVRGDNGELAIPRGARVELIVRVARDNDLILDLDSVMVNGERYAIGTEANRIQSQRDYSVVGSILGAINGGEVQGRAVRLPRSSLITFRLDRPLDIGVADRGVDRGGYHYHDYYGDPYRR
ncbi:MAG TPA: hypothetical protein VL127_19695 [Bryobacteraceae bacterium]|jgi:hypothetical protein|nr:hypothetical protein [Bryobacteraceae bacterium]